MVTTPTAPLGNLIRVFNCKFTVQPDYNWSICVNMWKSEQKEGCGRVPGWRQAATAQTYRPQCQVWMILFVHATEVSKGKKVPQLWLVFKVGAKEPIRRIRVDHHWFCLDVLWSPDCQSAAGSSEGNRFTWMVQNKHTRTESFFVFSIW